MPETGGFTPFPTKTESPTQSGDPSPCGDFMNGYKWYKYVQMTIIYNNNPNPIKTRKNKKDHQFD